MNNRINLFLAILLLICALLLVLSQQRARKLFIIKEYMQVEEYKLSQELLRLEYEKRNLSKAARICDIARDQLHMLPISAERTLYLIRD